MFILDGVGSLSPAHLAWTRLDDWLPQSTAQLGSLELKTLYIPPIDERGFAIQMTVHNTSESAKDVVIGLNGCWASSWHCVNEDKPLSGKATCFRSGWNSSLIFEYHAGFPMFAFAPMADAQTDSSFTCSDDGGIAYDLSHHCTIAADGTASVVFYWGLGFEEVAAATSAKEMLRQTFDVELTKTRTWLQGVVSPLMVMQSSHNSTIRICSSVCSSQPALHLIPKSWCSLPAEAPATM